MRMAFYIVVLLGLVIGQARASVPGFDRYRSILERKPFGDPPPQPVEERSTAVLPPAESFARHIRLSAVYETQEGDVRVGLVNNQNNDNFFLSVGESHEGIELVSASFADEEAVLRRGSEMAVVKLTESAAQPLTREQQEQRTRSRQTSYADRRRARQEALERRRAEPPPEPRLTGEELEEHLRNYQMDVIRQGLPPLPIPLTPEMDQQLVDEGVLPP